MDSNDLFQRHIQKGRAEGKKKKKKYLSLDMISIEVEQARDFAFIFYSV